MEIGRINVLKKGSCPWCGHEITVLKSELTKEYMCSNCGKTLNIKVNQPIFKNELNSDKKAKDIFASKRNLFFNLFNLKK